MMTLDDEPVHNPAIVIFANDDGGERHTDNRGLAKANGTLWEGIIRSPAFARWPVKIKIGSITQQAAISLDWTKTILSTGSFKDHKIPLQMAWI